MHQSIMNNDLRRRLLLNMIEAPINANRRRHRNRRKITNTLVGAGVLALVIAAIAVAARL